MTFNRLARTAAMDTLPCPNFDDKIAGSLFKLALLESYCRGELAADAVQMIFDQTPALKAA